VQDRAAPLEEIVVYALGDEDDSSGPPTQVSPLGFGEIARAIGEVLPERGFDTTVIPPEEVGSIEDYDAVVLGSGVYAGHWLELVGTHRSRSLRRGTDSRLRPAEHYDCRWP